MDLTFVELFAGVGGLSRGLEMAGWRCKGHAEWDAHPRAVLRKQWPEVPLWGDVSKLSGHDIVQEVGPFTMLTFGAPCQDFSIAGKRSGMEGERSVLVLDALRIWEESEAPLALYENVVGMLSSNNGADFAAILSAFVGSNVAVPARGWRGGGGVVRGRRGVAAWRVLDAQYFGVPQRRRRVFVLGTRTGGVDPAQVLSLLEGVSGDTPSRRKARQGASSSARMCLASESGAGFWDDSGLARLRAQGGGAPQNIVYDKGFSFSDSVGYITDVMPTIPVGISKGTGSQMMGVLTYSTPAIGDIREDAVASTITKNSGGGGETQNPAFVVAFDNRPAIQTDGVADTLTTEGSRNPMSVVMRNREGKPGGGKGPLLSAERERPLGTANDQVVFPAYRMVAFGEYAEDGTASAIKARDYKDATDLSVAGGVPRRLTPVECERLMGWEDGWTASGVDEDGEPYALSDTARYKACGNGVASPVAQWIGFRLRAALEGKHPDTYELLPEVTDV